MKIFALLLGLTFSFSSLGGELPSCPDNMKTIDGKLPRYPHHLRQKHPEGWVLLTGILNPSGTLENIRVIESEPARFFERSALKSAKTWRFDWEGSWCVFEYKLHYKVED